MKISEIYGPQYDPTDGTIGELQLVKRWVLVSGEDPEYWGTRQGRYTFETYKEAKQRAEVLIEANPNSKFVPADLRPCEYWCYPSHFDPLGPTDSKF